MVVGMASDFVSPFRSEKKKMDQRFSFIDIQSTQLENFLEKT